MARSLLLSKRATRGVGWCSRSRGRPPPPVHLSVVGLSDIPVWLFVVTDGSFTVFDAWAPDGIFRIPSRRLPTSASPSASSPSRAEPAHLAVRGVLPLLELRPCDGPSPDGPVNVHSRRIETLLRPTVATPPVSLRPRGFSPPRRFPPFTASGMSQPVPGLGFARFRADRSSKPKLLGLYPSSPLARHPAKVSSSSAAVPHRCGLLPSCRSSPATTSRSCSGFSPTPSEDEVKSSGSIHRCRLRRFRRTRQAPEAVFRPPCGDGCRAPVRRPSVGGEVAPSIVRDVRLDRVESPVARLWLPRPWLTLR
jgi:hypothetical protein